MSKFTPEQTEQYYRIRLDPYKLHHSKGTQYRATCPLHGGSNASALWVDTSEGNFFCFVCQKKGGSAYTFEMEFLRSQNPKGEAPNHDETMRSLEQVLGMPFAQRTIQAAPANPKKGGWDRRQARDSYRYTDELGEEQFTVWKFVTRDGGKFTPPDRPCACRKNPDAECEDGCDGGRVWGLKDCRRVLYMLPALMQSLLVFVVEGEKNANDLSRHLAEFMRKNKGFPLGDLIVDRVAVTTNVGGANGWDRKYGYGRYFFQKIVIKLGDNDSAGRLHDEAVCRDLETYAKQLFRLELPVGEGEDISDFLAGHAIEDFLKLLPNRIPWVTTARKEPTVNAIPDEERKLLVRPSELVIAGATAGGDWLVDGLIERGTRGLVVAPPKTGKSLLFLELVLCLATGRKFLGVKPYSRPVKCAVISREDGPTIVHRRLMQLAASRGIGSVELDRNIVVNTERQSARFKIDRPGDVEEMGDWLRAAGVEFCVIDVLNRLHDGQENSSDDMTKVMQRFDELAQRGGCQVCVIHHTNKAGGVKGSTAIEGWADYIVRLEENADDKAVKTLFLKTKLSGAVVPRSIRYWQSEDLTQSRIQLVEPVRRMEERAA